MSDRVLQELLDQLVNSAVKGGGEQQSLAVRRRRSENPLHTGEKPEVGHVVGFVEDCDIHPVEACVVLAHEVFEPTGARDDDVDTVLEGLHLAVLVHATKNGAGGEASSFGKGSKRRVDLDGELTGWGEDHRSWPVGRRRGIQLREPRDKRKEEREGLTGPGASSPEDVATSKGVGQRGCLDRGWGGDACKVEFDDEVFGHAKARKSRGCHVRTHLQ